MLTNIILVVGKVGVDDNVIDDHADLVTVQLGPAQTQTLGSVGSVIVKFRKISKHGSFLISNNFFVTLTG